MPFNVYFNRKHVFLCLLLMIFADSFALAGEPTTQNTNKNYAGHPHCGLYCLYSILKLEGQSIDFRYLIKPEYLGSRKGSSFEELKQASEDFGLNTVALSRLIPVDLKDITVPAILHVKSTFEQKNYDHFVLYLGEEDGKARIFDPPGQRSLVEFASLVPKWDGNALFISSGPLSASQIASTSQKRLVLYIGIAICGIFAFHGLKRFFPTVKTSSLQMGMSIGQAAGLVLVTTLVGLSCHYFYDGGFFANASAIEGIQKAYQGNFISKLTVSKMQKIYAKGSAVILDTRFQTDYEVGHIDSAISLPINCTDEAYAATVSELPKDKKIVLYCQSAGCKFAEKIAIRLKDDGFKNLAIFKGGWVEWQKADESKSTKTEGGKDEKHV